MARRTYASEQIKKEYRLLRDRLYHQAQRNAGKYTSKQAYNVVKEFMADITEVNEDVLEAMQAVYNSVLDVNNVDPYKYDESMYETVMDMIGEMFIGAVEGGFENYVARQVKDKIDNFVNSIGTKAFSDFIDNNPDVLHQIEVIASIYENAMAEADNGERRFDRSLYEYMEGQLNAALSAIDYMFNSYLNSEAYQEYKTWEAQVSAQIRNYGEM